MKQDLSDLLYIYKNADFLIKALNDKIDICKEQIEIIDNTFAEPSSPLLSDMPKAHEIRDKVAELVEKKEKAISLIESKIEKLKKEKTEIERQYHLIMSAINSLTNKERQIIDLFFKQDKTIYEVIKITNKRKKSIINRKNAAIHKLQEYIKENTGE